MVDIEVLKHQSLGDNDIINFLGGRTKVLKYNEINSYADISSLLHPYGNVVILLETHQDFGHWICIKQIGRVISFFDSYGDFPDKQKHYVNEKFLKESGQGFNIICKMLDEASHQNVIEFNDRRLQRMDGGIATCGHWCCVFIDSGLTIDPFYKYIDDFHADDLDALVAQIYYSKAQERELIPQAKRVKI